MSSQASSLLDAMAGPDTRSSSGPRAGSDPVVRSRYPSEAMLPEASRPASGRGLAVATCQPAEVGGRRSEAGKGAPDLRAAAYLRPKG